MTDTQNNHEQSNSSSGDNQSANLADTTSNAAQAVRNEVSNQTQQLGTTTKEAAAIVADQAKQAVNTVAQTVKDQANQVKGQATASVSDGASQVKDSLAESLEKAADAVNQKGQDMNRQDLVEPVSNRLRGSAQYLREREVGDLTSEIVQLVRRRPLQTLLGAFVFGYLFGKALRGGNHGDPWND